MECISCQNHGDPWTLVWDSRLEPALSFFSNSKTSSNRKYDDGLSGQRATVRFLPLMWAFLLTQSGSWPVLICSKKEKIFTFWEDLCVPSGYCKPANPFQITRMFVLLSEWFLCVLSAKYIRELLRQELSVRVSRAHHHVLAAHGEPLGDGHMKPLPPD